MGWIHLSKNAFPDTENAIQVIAPLVQLLRQELAYARISPPGLEPNSIEEFTHWYLAVVQLLETHIATGEGHQPMSRKEVELMCRCALSGHNLREAIDVCIHYCGMLYPRAGEIELEESPDLASFRLNSLRAETSTASSLSDITGLFAFKQLFQWLTGADLQLQQVCIGPIQRDDVLPFLKLFGSPVTAGGKKCTLNFPRRMLDLPIVRTAGEFSAFFEVYPCGVFSGDTHDLVAQVNVLLVAAARQGRGIPSQSDMANTLGIPLSTFRRRLARSGTSFRALREEVLQDSAQTLLLRRDVSIAEVAARLGFSDATAFRRAFRKWLGMTPSEWQQNQVHHVIDRPAAGRRVLWLP